MPTQRLSNLLIQRAALEARIAEARTKPTGHLVAPAMELALDALDDVIARERVLLAASAPPEADGP